MPMQQRESDLEIGSVDLSLGELYEVDPKGEFFEIVGAEPQDSLNGYMSLVSAEPTEVGSHFVLHVYHGSSSRYISASLDETSQTRKLSAIGPFKRGTSSRVRQRLVRRIGVRKVSDEENNSDDSNRRQQSVSRFCSTSRSEVSL